MLRDSEAFLAMHSLTKKKKKKREQPKLYTKVYLFLKNDLLLNINASGVAIRFCSSSSYRVSFLSCRKIRSGNSLGKTWFLVKLLERVNLERLSRQQLSDSREELAILLWQSKC